ncbi:hypothetical protein HDV00_010619 [Rhizophlyctis rosea]|nr:hypothetical protein HDV00_010619 [Rhizophlyctis rosea]
MKLLTTTTTTLALLLTLTSTASAGCPTTITANDYCNNKVCKAGTPTQRAQCWNWCPQTYWGHCWSEWNDGWTFNYHCDGNLRKWTMQDLGYNCWGDDGANGSQFWCQC